LPRLPSGEFELLSKPVGVPLVAFRLKQKTDEDGEQQRLPGLAGQHAANAHVPVFHLKRNTLAL
jgi:glutamate/tyrosine decarboxylase-like PLP-dependent enzyme